MNHCLETRINVIMYINNRIIPDIQLYRQITHYKL